MLAVQGETIGVHQYFATNAEGEIILYALQAYGYILKREGQLLKLKRFTFADFATLIARNYDTAEPRTAEIIKTLQTVHDRNKLPIMDTLELANNGYTFANSLTKGERDAAEKAVKQGQAIRSYAPDCFNRPSMIYMTLRAANLH